jgi:hypothetical protein
MLDVGKCTQLGAIGFSEVLLRFLTDDELDQLEKIVTRVGIRSPGTSVELERAGQIIWTAQRRAEMRHPGFE